MKEKEKQLITKKSRRVKVEKEEKKQKKKKLGKESFSGKQIDNSWRVTF